MSDAWVNKRQAEIMSEISLLKKQIVRSIDVVEHAKIVRTALKERFPDIKFKVVSARFSGGDSVTVYHVGGDSIHPRSKEISEFVHTLDGYDSDLMDGRYNIGFMWKGERIQGASFCTYNHGC